MHRDRADLAICGSTHIRAPYACAGGNDVVHGSFFQVTAGIFPDQAGDDVQREQLAVMSMTTEIKVCACGCHFIQLTRLMIYKIMGSVLSREAVSWSGSFRVSDILRQRDGSLRPVR